MVEAEKQSESAEIKSYLNKSIENFEDLGLKEELLRGIYSFDFEKPSIIQQRSILPIINKKDIMVQAQNGTGKTSAFSIGILQIVDSSFPQIQVLILVKSREIGYIIQRFMMSLAEYLNVVIYSCIANIQEDKNQLKEGVHVAIGIPERVNELIKKGYLKTEHLKFIVLDEADEMFARGYEEKIYEIFKLVPSDIQFGLFSDNLSVELLKLIEIFMKDPVKIILEDKELTLDGIKQFYIALEKEDWKFDTLVELYANLEITQCIIYCNSKVTVETLSRKLENLFLKRNLNQNDVACLKDDADEWKKNFLISYIQEDMDQKDRNLVMKKFKTGQSRVLITTDLLARDNDVLQVSLIINYDLPKEKEKYMNRIGRSGRFGRKGVVINFVGPLDCNFIQDVEKFYNTQIEEMPIDITDLFS